MDSDSRIKQCFPHDKETPSLFNIKQPVHIQKIQRGQMTLL